MKKNTAEGKVIADLKTRDEPLNMDDLLDDLFSLDAPAVRETVRLLEQKGIIKMSGKDGKLELVNQVSELEK